MWFQESVPRVQVLMLLDVTLKISHVLLRLWSVLYIIVAISRRVMLVESEKLLRLQASLRQ